MIAMSHGHGILTVYSISGIVIPQCPVNTPPILYTTSSLKWGEGLYSNMQLVSSIRERYVHLQSSCLHKNTVTKAFYTKQLIQDREYCSRTSRLQSFVVFLQRRRDFAVAVLKNSSTVGPVPREISRVCWYFLHKSGSEMTCSYKHTKDSLYSTHLQRNCTAKHVQLTYSRRRSPGRGAL